jgi:hypothetical protein
MAAEVSLQPITLFNCIASADRKPKGKKSTFWWDGRVGLVGCAGYQGFFANFGGTPKNAECKFENEKWMEGGAEGKK